MEMEEEDKMTVDMLHEEILLKTLGYLEQGDLKVATLVASSWNKIISSNTSTMKRLPLKVSDQENLEMIESSRNYVEIILEGSLTEETCRVIEKHGLKVLKLQFKSIQLEKEQTLFLLRVFKAVPNLRKILFESATTDSYFTKWIDDINKTQPVNLKHLKEIVTTRTDSTILSLFNKSHLTSLKINDEVITSPNINQPLIQTLAIRLSNVDAICMFKMPIKKLSLLMVSVDGLTEVVEKFKDTLEELELETLFELSFYEMIFKSLTKLKLLKLDPEDAPNDLKSYQSLRPNRSITTAIFQSNDGYNCEGFIGNMPNIETLVLNIKNKIARNLLMKFISLNLMKLKVLEVSRLNDDSFDQVKIPTLQELHIHATYTLTDDGWKKITENCPNIEQLTIGSVHDSFELSEKEMTTIGSNLKLKNLIIGCGFIGTEKLFNDLIVNCPSLKSFTIIENAISDDPAMINEFTKNGPKLFVRSLSFIAKRIDFNLWQEEDVCIEEDCTESSWGSEFSQELETDDDEMDEPWIDYDGNDDDDDDDEFQGNFRPG